jgi:hypothetical protein
MLGGGNIGVRAAARLAVKMHQRVLQIDHPDFRDAMTRVERDLDPPVQTLRGVGDFDEEQKVCAPGSASR